MDKYLKPGFLWRQRVGFGICDFACNVAYILVNTYLLFYYTDVAGLGAAGVGVMFVITKFIDAGTDYMVGALADRTHTKFGQYRPWMLAGAPVLAVGMVALFCVPGGISATGKLVYAYATYILFSFGYTLVNIPMGSVIPTLSADPVERTKIVTTRMACASLGSLTSASIVLPLVMHFSHNGADWAAGYRITNFILGIVVICVVTISVFSIKEINPAPPLKKEGNIFGDLKHIFTNKPFVLVMIECFLMCAGWLGTLSAMQYYFTYIIGDVTKMALATSLMTAAQLLAQLLTSIVNKYITKRNIIQIATVFQIVAYIGLLLIPGNLTLAYLFITINGFGLGSRMVIFFSMIPDTTDYGEYLCGRSLSGTQNAFTGFMNKLSSAAMSAVISALLVWGNYDQALTVQPDSAITAIKYGFCGIPLITCLISVVVMAFYNLDKIYPEVKKEIEKRRTALENKDL